MLKQSTNRLVTSEEHGGTVLVYDSDCETDERHNINLCPATPHHRCAGEPPCHDDKVTNAQRSTKLTRMARCAEALLSLQGDPAQSRRRRNAALLQLARIGGPYHALCTGTTLSLWVRYPGLDDAIIEQTERYFAEESAEVAPRAQDARRFAIGCSPSAPHGVWQATVSGAEQTIAYASGCRSPLPRVPQRSRPRIASDDTHLDSCVASGTTCLSATSTRAASAEEKSTVSTQAITESHATCVTDDGTESRSEQLREVYHDDDACTAPITPSRAEAMALQVLTASDCDDVCDTRVCDGYVKEHDTMPSKAMLGTSPARHLSCLADTAVCTPTAAFSTLVIYSSDEEDETSLQSTTKLCAAKPPFVSPPTVSRLCKTDRFWLGEAQGRVTHRRLETAAGSRGRCGAVDSGAPALAASVITEQQRRREQRWLKEQTGAA